MGVLNEKRCKKYKGEFIISSINISCNGIKFQFIKDEETERREITIIPRQFYHVSVNLDLKWTQMPTKKQPVDEILELLRANHITKDALLNYKITHDMIEEYDIGTNPKGILSIYRNDEDGYYSNTENLKKIKTKDHYSGFYYYNNNIMDKDIIEKAIKSEITKYINHFNIR